MKLMDFKTFVIFAISLMAFYSCAKDVTEDDEAAQRRVLQAYLAVNHYDDIEPISDGLYVIENTPGKGAKVADSCFVYVRYSVRYLSGIYASTTYDSVAKQLGSYKNINFYGDYVWAIGDGTTTAPLESIVKTMNVGGKTTSVVAPWITSTTSGNSQYTVTTSSESENQLYDIEVTDMVLDINQHQIDMLEKFSAENYGGVDSLSKGFYCVKTYDSGVTDTIPNEKSLSIWYIGRYLDGKIFDTNIADTAKRYHIYDSSSSYASLSVTYNTDPEEIVSGSSVVLGFAKAITSPDITFGDKCEAFFDSENGYGASGKISGGKGVPGYYPMFFEIWIEKDE